MRIAAHDMAPTLSRVRAGAEKRRPDCCPTALPDSAVVRCAAAPVLRRQQTPGMITVQEAARAQIRRTPAVSVFDLERWQASIANVWVLSRSESFTRACARGYGSDVNTVQLEAAEWRRASFLSVEDNQAGRGPVMLFPSVRAAWERLRSECGAASADYARSEVLARFPALDSPDRYRLMRSVWRADDPEQCGGLPLSHAAWWLATQGGTELIILDDWRVWKTAFEKVRRLLAGAQIPVFDKNGQDVSPRAFAVVGFDYPCSALARSPYVAGRHTYVGCALTPYESVDGDQFFAAGSDAAMWQNLMLSSAEFIRAAAIA
jgi:hypothetical protein